MGGVILLGVEDNSSITGIGSIVYANEWVMNIARNNVVPTISVTFSTLEIEGQQIGIIEVPKGKDKPYQTSDYRFMVRVSSTNR